MRIEHFAFQASEPAAFARWHGENLGMKIARSGGAPTHTHFLADSEGGVLVEVYRNESAPLPDYATQDPLVVHLAFVSADPEKDATRLAAAGASIVSGPATTAAGDVLVMLRDPWGFPFQLCRRVEPMLSL